MSVLDPIAYRDGDLALTGLLARPPSPLPSRPRGAVLVVPTIANPTPPIERRAAMLAEAGFLALVADLYGFAPDGMAAARAAADALRADVSVYRRRVRAGLAALVALPEAAGLRCAAVGYCLGGQAALELARDGADLVGVASFHGLLDTALPAAPGAIGARLLICHGQDDPLVPREQVTGFWDEMDAAGASYHFHAYSGVRHGFTDPGSDARGMPAIGYDASADRQSWSALMGFFDELFGT